MLKNRIFALIVIFFGALLALFVYNTTSGLSGKEVNKRYEFKLGLDLSGGTHLVYRADVGNIDDSQVKDSMIALRDVLERRINLFGVSETRVFVQDSNFLNQGERRIVIDLPGVTDINEAVEMIGQTPLLEFKIERPEGPEKDEMIQNFIFIQELLMSGELNVLDIEDPYFINTELTGRYLQKASLDFTQTGMGIGGEPIVILRFNREGALLFERITQENIGKLVAIYLDGAPISTPVVREAISGGEAIISGNFTPDEAKQLVGRLNSGALPVPIELISTQTIGPSLGVQAIDAGIRAAVIGLIILAIFFVFWYRLLGLVAIVALIIYSLAMFSLFKLIPITLTAAGIAGFIISLGLAVDANILIFERIKEEFKTNKSIQTAIDDGFERAWLSIRDSNLSSIITATILFWFGTSLIQGFALTFGIGVLVSMISAISISRILLKSITNKDTKISRFLLNSGFPK